MNIRTGSNYNFKVNNYALNKVDLDLKTAANFQDDYEYIDYSSNNKTDFQKMVEEAEKSGKIAKTEIKAAPKKAEPSTEEKDTGASLWDYCRTIVGGGIEGFLGVGEGVIDAHLYGTGLTIKLLTWGKYGDGLAYDAVGYDVSGKVENAITYGVDEDLKNSGWSSIPRFMGHGTGYSTIAKIPFVGVALAAQGGAGKEAEKSINKQMAETGTINDWEVLYRSFLGSIEGFVGSKLSKAGDKFKSVGAKGIASGTKNLTKQGFWAFVKNQGVVFKSAAVNSIKDPRIWADTAGITVKKIESIISGNYSKMDLALDLLGIPTSVKFWDGVGEAGLSFVEMFK